MGDAKALFAGIPQKGIVLGSPRAPVTLVEYADLQCPFCRDWARLALPVVVKDYVRHGRVRIEFRGVAFIGSDSTKALAAALAAGLQDHLWQVVDLFYANQGAENSGWVDDSLLNSIASAVELDRNRFDSDRSSAAVVRTIDRLAIRARVAGIASTPSFLVGRTGKTLTRVEVTSLHAEGIRPAIERALRS